MGLSASSAISISGPLIPALLTKGNQNGTQGTDNQQQQQQDNQPQFEFVQPDPLQALFAPNQGSTAGFSDDIFINAFYGPPNKIFSNTQVGSRITNLAFGSDGSGGSGGANGTSGANTTNGGTGNNNLLGQL
jgi:hypothetical protein